MIPFRHFWFSLSALFFIYSSLQNVDCEEKLSNSSIYDVLNRHGLPMGLLPKGVKNFSIDDSGKFQVFLDQACNAKFENQLHYDMNVSGIIRYGQIEGLSGMDAQELFLWFPVKEIRVDIPSSGVIYFDVGVAFKRLSLSLFETPRDCFAAPCSECLDGRQMVETVSKIIQHKLDRGNILKTSL